MQKLAIVGAGRVGEAAAQVMAQMDIFQEIVLLDVVDGKPQGAALDIQESGPLLGFDTRLSGSTRSDAMEGADMVVITAGVPRKPGMARSDVLAVNLKIVDKILEDVVHYAPNAKLMIVTNPVDSLTYRAFEKTGWNRSRVFGQAGVLDSTRMASFVAMETGFSMKDIEALVLGSHGDHMVPMPRYTTISGVPVDRFLSEKTIQRIIQRTRSGGAEILHLKQTGSAYQAPGAAIATMVSTIFHDRKRVLPAITLLEGEYDYDDLTMGVPCRFGEGGMEEIIQLDFTKEERLSFDRCAAHVRAEIETIMSLTEPLSLTA